MDADLNSDDEFEVYRQRAYTYSEFELCRHRAHTYKSTHDCHINEDNTDEEDSLNHMLKSCSLETKPSRRDSGYSTSSQHINTNLCSYSSCGKKSHIDSKLFSKRELKRTGAAVPGFVVMDTDSSDKSTNSTVTSPLSPTHCTKLAQQAEELELPLNFRPRTTSMPSKHELLKCVPEEGQLYRVRSFSTSGKAVVNQGDTFRIRSTSSQASLESSGSGSGCDEMRSRTSSMNSQDSGALSTCSLGQPPIHKVLLLGSSEVGKTALLQQFMTSEYMGNMDLSLVGK